jgi:hypothetical protein
MQPERRQAKGPQPKPRWMPVPGLLYAQVVKSYLHRRITAVTHRVVFGARETIESILAKRGWKGCVNFRATMMRPVAWITRTWLTLPPLFPPTGQTGPDGCGGVL